MQARSAAQVMRMLQKLSAVSARLAAVASQGRASKAVQDGRGFAKIACRIDGSWSDTEPNKDGFLSVSCL